MYTPMSKMVEVTNLMSPKTGSHSSTMALWNTWPPSSSGVIPEAAAVARPMPSRVPAPTGVASRSSKRPPAR